ncbi:hypothetical protein C7M84_011087 [Penaeus vannamei]|uniref:Uncharacterized protein n=1 Tax=Penaeus vannamei TaxID=6689 RepID=A0A3R7PLS8_PENVA|nr:hypothetical protein C7M84_011087 [Penaeus vannamei]
MACCLNLVQEFTTESRGRPVEQYIHAASLATAPIIHGPPPIQYPRRLRAQQPRLSTPPSYPISHAGLRATADITLLSNIHAASEPTARLSTPPPIQYPRRLRANSPIIHTASYPISTPPPSPQPHAAHGSSNIHAASAATPICLPIIPPPIQYPSQQPDYPHRPIQYPRRLPSPQPDYPHRLLSNIHAASEPTARYPRRLPSQPDIHAVSYPISPPPSQQPDIHRLLSNIHAASLATARLSTPPPIQYPRRSLAHTRLSHSYPYPSQPDIHAACHSVRPTRPATRSRRTAVMKLSLSLTSEAEISHGLFVEVDSPYLRSVSPLLPSAVSLPIFSVFSFLFTLSVVLSFLPSRSPSLFLSLLCSLSCLLFLLIYFSFLSSLFFSFSFSRLSSSLSCFSFFFTHSVVLLSFLSSLFFSLFPFSFLFSLSCSLSSSLFLLTFSLSYLPLDISLSLISPSFHFGFILYLPFFASLSFLLPSFIFSSFFLFLPLLPLFSPSIPPSLFYLHLFPFHPSLLLLPTSLPFPHPLFPTFHASLFLICLLTPFTMYLIF